MELAPPRNNLHFGDKLNPDRTHKRHSTFNGARQVVRLTNNPSTVKPRENLRIHFSTLGLNDVIAPGTAKLTFDLTIPTGAKLNENLARTLVEQITVSVDGQNIFELNNSDVLFRYMEKWPTPQAAEEVCYERGMIHPTENTENVMTLRMGGAVENATAEETKIAAVYGNRFTIPLDFELFSTTSPFGSGGLSGKVIYTLKFSPSSKVLKSGTGDYSIDNIQLEFTKITSPALAQQAMASYSSNFALFYDRIINIKTFSFSSKETLLNWTFTTPTKSLKGILLLEGSHTNLDIENIKITIEGVNNMLYDNGLQNKDIYEEAKMFLSGAFRKDVSRQNS